MNHPDSLCWTRPELDHGHCPSSTECGATEPARPELVELLAEVELNLHMIRAALADEHEGNVRAHTFRMTQAAASAMALVGSW